MTRYEQVIEALRYVKGRLDPEDGELIDQAIQWCGIIQRLTEALEPRPYGRANGRELYGTPLDHRSQIGRLVIDLLTPEVEVK